MFICEAGEKREARWQNNSPSPASFPIWKGINQTLHQKMKQSGFLLFLSSSSFFVKLMILLYSITHENNFYLFIYFSYAFRSSYWFFIFIYIWVFPLNIKEDEKDEWGVVVCFTFADWHCFCLVRSHWVYQIPSRSNWGDVPSTYYTLCRCVSESMQLKFQ